MKILLQPIKNYNIVATTNRSNKKTISPFALPQLENDTLVFNGKKKDLLEKSETEIFNIIDKSIAPKNMVGYGGLADVYNIPNTNYCVRLLRNGLECGIFHKEYTNYKTKPNKDLTTLDKFNHVVLKLGNSATVMQKVEGSPIASKMLSHEEILANTKIISKFPLKSYEYLLKNIITAYKEGILFDPHPSNIILNAKEQTFTPIDYEANSFNFPLEPIHSLFFSLVPDNIDSSTRNKITNKIFKTILKEIKSNDDSSLKIEEYDFTDFFERYKAHYNIDFFKAGLEFLRFEQNISKLIYLKFAQLTNPGLDKEFNKLWEITYKQLDKVFRAR